jgi:hypothetical protein
MKKELSRRGAETQKVKDFFFYVGELESEECFCGRNKQSGKALCFKCFRDLPFDMRNGLYQQIGNGFEAAYDAAVKYLEAVNG